MTTKDIIENMKKEFDELTFKYEGIDEPLSLDSKEEAIIKSFIHSYTLTLLESFGEEIINKLEEEINVVLDSKVVKNGNATRECIDGTFTYSRLKVKEIINLIR